MSNYESIRSIFISSVQYAGELAALQRSRREAFLETACDQESNKWVQRGIVVGLALYCERADMLERYIKTLREDTEASSINIGYHLVYYGDQAQEQGYYDHGSEQIDGTIQALFRRLQNKRYQNGWLLDLYTLATLLEQRGVAILKPYKLQLAFLREFLSRDNQHQSTIFQQEKRRLEDILQETILWT